MKTYGLILADNGSNWYFQGTADTALDLHRGRPTQGHPGESFVAVDESCLMVSANSGQALQPGSAAYQAKCDAATGASRH